MAILGQLWPKIPDRETYIDMNCTTMYLPLGKRIKSIVFLSRY